MKKCNTCKTLFLQGKVFTRIFRVMKITVFFLLLAISSSFANSSYSQNTRFSFRLENVTIQKVFDEIQKKSEFIIFYKDSQVDLTRRTNVDVVEATVEQILDQTLKGTNLGYKIIDRQVVILTDENKESPSILNPALNAEQKKELSGIVRDSKGLPLPGVTVVVKGTTIGTITGNDGQFKFSVPTDAKVLVFSFVGMKSQEFLIASKLNFSIVMTEEAVAMDDVVVVGYGFQKKESVVGAITQVNNQALVRSGNSNVTNAIAGKLSGVLTIQQSGEPGANDSEIIIRGLSSWNGSAPLVLVDGVERDFNTLDPNEINTISVLKDASATAVFGAKGANGVIIVTTKRGNLGKPQLDFSASYGMQKATMIPDHINSYTTMSMLNVAYMNDLQFQSLAPQSVLNEYRNPSTPLNALRYPNVNWFNELTRNFAPTINANFNVSGGTNFVKYFCSLGFMQESDLFNAKKDGFYDLNFNYKRFNYRSNVDFQLTKSTKLSFNLGGETGIKNSPNDSRMNWLTLYASSPSRFPAYYPAWVLEQVPDPDYPNEKGDRISSSLGDFYGSPYVKFNSGAYTQYIDSKLFTDILIDQKLDFVTKGLSFAGKVALSTYYQNNIMNASRTYPDYQLNYDNIGKPGVNPWVRTGQGAEYYKMAPLDVNVGGLQGNFYRDLYYELGVNYANSFGKHSVTGLALLNRSQKNRGTEFAYYNEALVGRGTYDYSHKYLFEVNVGYTGSERFAPGNRFGFFPSGAIGWVVSEEKFFKDAVPGVSKLKLRYSDGLTGSDAAGSRWLYNSGYYSDNATGGPYLHEDLGANSTAQWEEARKRDIGIELGLFKNTLTLNVDLFDEYRDKMLLSPRSVTMVIGNSFKDLNLGKLKKHGIEIEIEFNKTTPTNLNYWAKGVFGYNENRIIFKDDLPYAPDYTKSAGTALGAKLNGMESTGTGYYTSIDDIHNNAASKAINLVNVGDYKFLDYMVDGKISSLDQHPIKGSTYPPITFSFSGGLKYKKFEFNLMFQGNLGKFADYTEIYETEFLRSTWRVHTSQLDYWTPTNSGVNHATLHYSNYTLGGNGQSWRNSDYVRLKEVYAGYNMSSKFLNHLAGVSNILIYATGNNLWTLTHLVEGDPERKDFYEGFYPQTSTVKLGVKVAF